MTMTRRVIRIRTTDGDGEAIRSDRHSPWHISHPCGGEVFYGNLYELRQHVVELLGNDFLGMDETHNDERPENESR